MKKLISLVENNFRSFFGLVFPVLITLGIVFAGIQFYIARSEDEINRKRNLWNEKAQIVLASVRANHTFSSLVSESGNRLAKDFEADSSGFKPEVFVELVNRHFDASLIDNEALIWLFKVNNAKVLPVNANGLTGTHQRVMQRVMQSFIEFANNPDMDQNEISRLEKFVRSVFGTYSAPLQVGRKREGKTTPVNFEGRKYYLYWRQFKNGLKTEAVTAILFPVSHSGNIEKILQTVADKTLEETKRHLAVAFVPIDSLSNHLRLVLPEQIDQNQEYRRLLVNTLKKVVQRTDDKGKQIFETDGHLFLRGFLTVDIPYDAIIFSPTPKALKMTKPDITVAAALVVVFWALIFTLFYWKNGRPGLPLAASFRVLFFLTGLIPISVMLSAGYSLIEESYQNEIIELKRENSQKLSNINERSDILLQLFGYHISEIIKNPRVQNLLNNGNSNDTRKAFNAIRNKMLSLELSLDYMFAFYPGISSEMLVADQRIRQTAKTHMNLMGPGVFKINQILSKMMPLPETLMDSGQKNFYQILSGLPNEFLAETFFMTYEKPTFVSYGNTGKDYFFSVILTRNGRIASYLIFAASSESFFRRYLTRELDMHNINDANIFLAAELLPNTEFSIFPFKKMRALQSKAGKKAFSLMKKCRSSIFEKSITDSDYLYLFYPMSKMPNFAGGCIVSLAKPDAARQMKKLFLEIAAVMLACLMYVASSLATSHMLMPLERINLVLHNISRGNLDLSLCIERQDELGQLANTVNLMQNGFKERLRLGKFVSTTLDKSLSNGSSFEELKKAREITGTVLFSDIRNFTTLSESFPPADIAAMLNSHLETMSKKIQTLGGQIEQFIGDAIVAFFPDKEFGDSRLAALKAALAVHSAHQNLNQLRHEEGRFTYAIGIGLQHGTVIAGSLVTPGRYEFSIIGEARHQAEEFEALSKLGSHTRIIVSHHFVEPLEREAIAVCKPLNGTDVFELLERSGEA